MRQFWDAARSPLICNKSTAITVRLTGSIGKFFRFSSKISDFDIPHPQNSYPKTTINGPHPMGTDHSSYNDSKSDDLIATTKEYRDVVKQRHQR